VIFIVDFRGDIRKSILGRTGNQEGENIFGANSMTGVALFLLVKSKANHSNAIIKYLDIGKVGSRKAKLEYLEHHKSFFADQILEKLEQIHPDEDNDWLNQGDKNFKKYYALGNKSDPKDITIFNNYSAGLKTGRDPWCINFSKLNLENNIIKFINTYNQEIQKFHENGYLFTDARRINNNPKEIKWTRGLLTISQSKKKLLSRAIAFSI